MNLWFSLALLFLGVELISAAKPKNAYSDNIDACLFTAWTKGTTAVLSSTPDCSDKSKYFSLCYNLNSKGTAKIAICYNNETLTPAFTGHIVEKVTGSGRGARFKKDTGTFAPKPQAEVKDYSFAQQKIDFPDFNLKTQHYCSKGHLTPNADFGPKNERALTFILTNVAPQWQKFNGGNWNVLERALQKYINAQPAGTKVYLFTGVGGEAKDTSGNTYKMNDRVVAPKYFWKAICDPTAKESVVFVGENPVGSWITTTAPGCNGKMQTHQRGVMDCMSLNDAQTKHADFKLPSFLDANCKISTRGTFLDSYVNFK